MFGWVGGLHQCYIIIISFSNLVNVCKHFCFSFEGLGYYITSAASELICYTFKCIIFFMCLLNGGYFTAESCCCNTSKMPYTKLYKIPPSEQKQNRNDFTRATQTRRVRQHHWSLSLFLSTGCNESWCDS